MNKDLLESQWAQIRALLIEKFGNLTEEDIREINGRYDELVTKLQQRYGYSREEAEERIRNWNFDRFATPRAGIIREETVKRERENSLYKWLLALGIPLLLLGSFFLLNRAPETLQTPPTAVQERTLAESPADLVISTGLRNALMVEQNIPIAVQNIQITTQNGVVTLTGSVPNAEARDFIQRTAQNFTGVKQVINHIEIK